MTYIPNDFSRIGTKVAPLSSDQNIEAETMVLRRKQTDEKRTITRFVRKQLPFQLRYTDEYGVEEVLDHLSGSRGLLARLLGASVVLLSAKHHVDNVSSLSTVKRHEHAHRNDVGSSFRAGQSNGKGPTDSPLCNAKCALCRCPCQMALSHVWTDRR